MLKERLAASLGDLRGVRASEKLDDKEVRLVGDAISLGKRVWVQVAVNPLTNYSSANFDLANELLYRKYTGIKHLWNVNMDMVWSNTFIDIMHNCNPRIALHSVYPWITSCIEYEINKRNNLYKKYKIKHTMNF